MTNLLNKVTELQQEYSKLEKKNYPILKSLPSLIDIRKFLLATKRFPKYYGVQKSFKKTSKLWKRTKNH